MRGHTAAKVGSALFWKAVQLFGSKAVSLVRFLILARLLAPEDFGLLAIAAVAIELMMALTKLGETTALVQRKEVDKQHYDTAWTLGILRAVVVAVILAIGAPFIAELFGEPRCTDLLRVLGLKPLLDATASVKLVDLTRNLRFQPIAVIVLPPLLVDTTVAIALAQSLGVWALVAGAFAGSVSNVALSYIIARHHPRLYLEWSAVRSLIGFGKWLLVTSVIGIIGHVVLRAVISRRLGVAELGIFYLALKLTVLPNDVAGEVIRSVAFPVVSKVQDQIFRVQKAFQASLIAMLAVLMPIYAVMIALSPSLTEHLLGPQWTGLVPVIQLLALDGIIDVVADATKPLFLGLGQPHKRAGLKGVRTLVIIALAWPLTTILGVVGAALAWVTAETVQFAAALAMARKALPHPFAGLGAPVGAIVASSAAGAGTAWWVDGIIPGITGLSVGAVAALLVAGSLLLLLDRRYRLGLTSDFTMVFPAIASRLSLASESR